MKNTPSYRLVVLVTALVTTVLPSHRLAAADEIPDAIQSQRGDYKVERQTLVAEAMQLTDSESAAFWPLYHQYRAEQEKLGDSIVKLVLEYADVYPNVPEARAKQMLKNYMALEKQFTAKRAAYLKKFAKILPAAKTLRLAQVENRLDLALRLQLASAIPLTPIEGKLTGSARMTTVKAEGVPGGIAVQTFELTATVTAIDAAARKLTLLSPDGIMQTFKVGPEAVNFDQIRVGDRLRIKATRQLVVSVADESQAPGDGGAQLVALAPEGAKPGGIMAETAQVTATVVAIDPDHHTATLRFDDGSTKTVAVRPDVDLSNRKAGDKVIIRVTEALALSIEER